MLVLHASRLVQQCCRAEGFSMKGRFCSACLEFVGCCGVHKGAVWPQGFCAG
jgi:hypothetical protein